MNINSAVRYTVRQFINDFLTTYGIFSYQTIYQYEKALDGRDAIIYVNNYYLPFTATYGATKLCLIFDDCDYVIKIPIYANLERDEGRTLSKSRLEKVKRGRYVAFENKENYCEKEANLYSAAEEWDINRFFAEEERIMVYHGVPVYAQEKIEETYEDSERYVGEDDADLLDDVRRVIDRSEYGFDVEMFLDNTNFINDLYTFDEEGFSALLDFIEENGINDLHSANVGYNRYGEPKIIDYSGFGND